jgi:hypothetical protein
MNEQAFLQSISQKAGELHINPILLLSGMEGLFTFKDIPLNQVNYDFLDSLILTIFALRIGDRFHEHARENLLSTNDSIREKAAKELQLMSSEEIEASNNAYLASFARILNGKSPVRNYHVKALEAAAMEINNVQIRYNATSISSIMLYVFNEFRQELNIGSLFGNS